MQKEYGTLHHCERSEVILAECWRINLNRDKKSMSQVEWKEYSVQELIDLGMLEPPMDGNHGEKHPKSTDYVSEGIPFVMANDLSDGTVNLKNCYFITQEQADSLDKGFAKPGDVLLTHKATLGRTAIVPDSHVLIVLTPQVTYYRCRKGIYNKYLKYYFDSQKFQQLFQNWAGSGSTRLYLGITAQRKLPILLPPLEEQKRIAGILSSLDDKIELNNKINDNLEKQAQALFKNWFIDYTHFGGVMPGDWKKGKLSDIATIKKTAFHPEKNPGLVVEHYSLPALDEKHYPVFEVADGIKSNKFMVTKESVLISKLNPDTKRIWRPYCLSEYPICSTEFVVFESINGFHRDYLYSIIDCAQFYDFMGSLVTGCTNSHQRVSPETLLTYPVAIPSKETLKSFCAKVTPLYEMIEKNVLEIQRLTNLRDTLLPKLMSGEIDVENIQI